MDKLIKKYKRDLLKFLELMAKEDGFNIVYNIVFTIDKRCINIYINGLVNNKKMSKSSILNKSKSLIYLRFLKKYTSLELENAHIYTDFKTVNLTVVVLKNNILEFKHLKF